MEMYCLLSPSIVNCRPAALPEILKYFNDLESIDITQLRFIIRQETTRVSRDIALSSHELVSYFYFLLLKINNSVSSVPSILTLRICSTSTLKTGSQTMTTLSISPSPEFDEYPNVAEHRSLTLKFLSTCYATSKKIGL